MISGTIPNDQIAVAKAGLSPTSGTIPGNPLGILKKKTQTSHHNFLVMDEIIPDKDIQLELRR